MAKLTVAPDSHTIRARKNESNKRSSRRMTTIASFSNLGAPSVLLILLIWSTPSAHAFTQNLAPGYGISSRVYSGEASSEGATPEPEQDVSKKKRKKKKSKRSVSYDVASGQNKSLDHLRKNIAYFTNNTDPTVGEMTKVDFWGAGYSQDSRSIAKPRVPSARQARAANRMATVTGRIGHQRRKMRRRDIIWESIRTHQLLRVPSVVERESLLPRVTMANSYMYVEPFNGGTTSLSGLS